MPTPAEQLASLRALPFIEVVELVKVSWPSPDGAKYYVSTLSEYLLRDLPLSGVDLDLRLPRAETQAAFQEILNDTTIGDDRVQLKLWDADGTISDLAHRHGPGQRVEIFYWFPQVALLWPMWWGHRQPAESEGVDWYECSAEVGFMSSMLPLPKRGHFTTCQAMFGGWLETQAEIDQGGCPYNRHLTEATLEAWDPVDDANVDLTGGGVIKDAGGAAWNAGVRHSVAINEGDEAIIKVTRGGPYAAAGFATTATVRNSNTDFLVNLQWNPEDSLTIQSNAIPSRPNAARSVSGDDLEIHLRAGRFHFYKAGGELVFPDWTPPAPRYPLYLGVAIQNEGAGVTDVQVKIGTNLPAAARGNLDPDTDAPFVTCPRNNRAACIARLEPPGATDAPEFLADDTVVQSYIVGQTKGPNITVTTRSNQTELRQPKRVFAGKRHVSDLPLLAYTVEPDTRHPEAGFVACLFEIGEGPLRSQSNQSINGVTVGAEHLNAMNGLPRQPRTAFSANAANYSRTALFFGRTQGDFTKTTADQLHGEVDVEGLMDVRRYLSETTYVEEYSSDRAWWLLHCLRNKIWGYGLDVARFMIEEDWIPLSRWCSQIVSFTDVDGTLYTGPRTSFNAELIDRTVQQQISDICSAGRFTLPFPYQGKLRIMPLGAAPELLTPVQFTMKAFLGALNRQPSGGEESAWVSALEAAMADGAALLIEAQARVKSLFALTEYTDLATDDETFVTDCYESYLGRVPEPGGLEFYLNLLGTISRSDVCDDFGASPEFSKRVAGMMGLGIPVFTDEGPNRNICLDRPEAEGGKSTLRFSEQSDKDLPNYIIVNFDDEEHKNASRPIPIEDPQQQLRAGRAFGDTTSRVVRKEYSLLGVTNLGEAVRVGNLLLHLGEFDEGGTENNLRAEFVAWFSDCLELHKYSLIKVESSRLDRRNAIRAEQDLPPFNYFRIREMRHLPNLQVQISAQAYAREYYDSLEDWTKPPPVIGSGIRPNPGGGPTDRPQPLPIDDGDGGPDVDPDRIRFRLPMLP